MVLELGQIITSAIWLGQVELKNCWLMIEFSCDLAFQLWSPYGLGWIRTSHLAYLKVPKGTICLYWIMVLHVMSYSALLKELILKKGAIVYQVLVVGIYLSNSDYLCHYVGYSNWCKEC